MKKKLIYLIVLIIFVLSLTACSFETNKQESNNGKLSIVTTIFPQYDFARQIVGDKADVTMLLKPGSESHSYEPTPQDIKTIQNCDLFIYTGGENEVWVEDILNSMGEKKPQSLKLIDCVTTVNEEIVEGMEHNHEHEHEDNHEHEDKEEIDEHVWTSPKNAIKIVDKISDLICSKDSKNADTYKNNTQNYIADLQDLDKSLTYVVDNAKCNTIIFGDRFPFRYLVDDYGLKYYAAFAGCSSETEASASTISFLIDKVNEEKTPVVFTIEFSNEKIADSICEVTGAKKLKLNSCHNLSDDEMQAGETYLSLMKNNVENLRDALN